MRITTLAKTFAEIEKTSSRNEITRLLAGLLSQAEANEIDKICYLALGELLPSYQGVEFNIAEKMLARVLAEAHNVPLQEISKRFVVSGDLGNIAYEISASKKSADNNPSISEIYAGLLATANESGAGSQERKIQNLASIINKVNPLSAKFIIRILAGKLRLGFSEATILDSLSVMIKEDKSARNEIERAYNVTADIGKIAQLLKQNGLSALAKIEPCPGIPVMPSLAERMPDPEKVIEKLGPVVAIESKLDGLRSTVHVWIQDKQKETRIFSRNLENTTLMFPEIVRSSKELNVSNIILDGEAIGYNPENNKFAPFQETAQRKRKHNIEKTAERVPLAFFAFDILYLNGKSLLNQSMRERKKILETVLPKPTGMIYPIKTRFAQTELAITEELEKSIKLGFEGVVIKNPISTYKAGSRGFHWVKIKPASSALSDIRSGSNKKNLADTIDCVLMGAYRGKGKRATFGFGGFLLGVRGKDEKFYTISRLGTGLSDEDFNQMSLLVKRISVKEKPTNYVADKEIAPDTWVKPEIIIETLADEITLSPRHTAGRETNSVAAIKEPQSKRSATPKPGYSLRFPRLVRLRHDKSPRDATSIQEIERLYRLQGRDIA